MLKLPKSPSAKTSCAAGNSNFYQLVHKWDKWKGDFSVDSQTSPMLLSGKQTIGLLGCHSVNTMPTVCVDSSQLWLHILLLGVIKYKSLVSFGALERCQVFFFFLLGSKSKNKCFIWSALFLIQLESKVLLTAALSSNSSVCGDPLPQNQRNDPAFSSTVCE